MRNVRIGITTSYASDEQRLRLDYVRAVEAAGGVPVPLPMTANEATVAALVELVDGLVITGGPAVVEGLVGTLPDDLEAPAPVRAASDLRLLDACWKADRPILGVCYGMQLLNAYTGGTIYADVERQHDGALTHSQRRGATTHPIRIAETSRLHTLLKKRELTVNTRHLQAVATLGKGFAAAATAPDGVVEAIEHENGRILGVQFHPERMGEAMQPLFRALVQQARSASAAPDPQNAVTTVPS